MLNPLFPADNDQNDRKTEPKPASGQLRGAHRFTNRIEPLRNLKPKRSDANPAANLIRKKIDALFEREPSARKEIAEVKHEDAFSKHQKFMLELSKSGKGLAEIQTEWHNYYVALPDEEKHEVWREFYEHNGKESHYQTYAAKHHKPAEAEKSSETHKPEPEHQPAHSSIAESAVNPNDSGVFVSEHTLEYEDMPQRHRTRSDLRRQIVGRVNAGGKLRARHHLQSLLFGIGMGAIVVIITLFSFFNEYIIAPFIQPSRDASATPLIVGNGSCTPSTTPEVIIPKINVEIPLNFSVSTTNEDQIENALEDGVVHYPTTVLPGQKGNTAFFGHSSNNIFNPGHYKFAFALLHDIVPGDTFYLTYGGACYAYQVFQKQIVDPSDVAVLNNVPNYVATATLITCDPPGTSLHRLVVWGTQVSPNPSANTTGTNTSTTLTNATQLPSNGPSLWSRFIHGLFGWL